MKRAALVLATVLVPALALAQTPVDQKRPAAAAGKVTIENMSGSVKVTGWDRAEVQVKGTLGEGAELSFAGGENQTSIEVEAEHGNPMGIKSDLEVFVPAGSSVDVEGPDAMLLDIRMPGMDGWEVLSRASRIISRRNCKNGATAPPSTPPWPRLQP